MGLFDEENRKTERVLVKKTRTLAKRNKRIFYLNASILGIYGWQMAMPVLLGILLGGFLDKHFGVVHFSWMLNLIIIGFGIGVFNANRWVHQEGVLKQKKQKRKKK